MLYDVYEKTTHNGEQLATTINAVNHAVMLSTAAADHIIISATGFSLPGVDSTVLLLS